MEEQLQLEFPQFKRIWLQRSKYSVCVTLFPAYGSQYRMLFLKECYHGMGQKMEYEPIRQLISEFVNKKESVPVRLIEE